MPKSLQIACLRPPGLLNARYRLRDDHGFISWNRLTFPDVAFWLLPAKAGVYISGMSREYVLRKFRSAVHLQIDYRKELNDQQWAAVTAEPGPALVIAGAGAGKTRTLTYRVAYLLEQGVPADRILLLTFTNKAAREMMGRVSDLLGSELSGLWGGTFHGIGNRVLRRHAEVLGYQRDFSILDSEDAKDLLKTCIGKADIDIKETRFPKPNVVGAIFSLAVNLQQPIGQVIAEQFSQFSNLTEILSQLAQQYAKRKRAANSMDFDDLLALWLKLLKEHPDVCDHYQKRFQFILVDEYQDTNRLQCDLIDTLAARHQNVMVVGDDSQSIYGWRGADFQNILRFPERYPKAKMYKVEVNYRSTPEILTLANAAIAANAHQFEKKLSPVKPSGEKPVVVTCGDAGEQAAFVAQRILELREEGVELKNMAVLYRSHFHALELQLELTRRNIPFSITSGIRFFEQAHIKDVTAYLKWVCNPFDEVSFKRIALLLPGIGAKSADTLWELIVHELQSARGGNDFSLCEVLRRLTARVPKRAKSAWRKLVDTVENLEEPDNQDKPARMITVVVEAGYEEYAQRAFENFDRRLEELEQLANFAMQFESNEDFLAQLALLTNVEAEHTEMIPREDEEVRLSTIHQAKGLEFDVVFVIMLCEGLFPSHRSLENLDGEEEERRLFYVAVTRAREQLYLSYPIIRLGQGYGDMFQQPSRFLEELPEESFEEWNLKSANRFY